MYSRLLSSALVPLRWLFVLSLLVLLSVLSHHPHSRLLRATPNPFGWVASLLRGRMGMQLLLLLHTATNEGAGGYMAGTI